MGKFSAASFGGIDVIVTKDSLMRQSVSKMGHNKRRNGRELDGQGGRPSSKSNWKLQ